MFRVVVVALLLSGCVMDAGTEHTSHNKSVGNTKDNFGYSLSAYNSTTMESYTWENGATRAMIGLSGSVTSGSVSLVIKDGLGQTKFSHTFTGKESQGVQTQRGVAGGWTISLEFTQFTGAVSLGINADYS